MTSHEKSSRALVALINFSFKSLWSVHKLILAITWEHRFQIWFHFHLSSMYHSLSRTLVERSFWKFHQGGDLISVEINKVGERMPSLETLREPSRLLASFIMCGNPNDFKLIDGWLLLFFPFRLPTTVFWFWKKAR